MRRQYSGTAGRTENCQTGTFLAYASCHGHALIDRELYLPESWTDDRDRCRAAGVPDEVEFATKPRQLMAMLGRAIDAGVPFAWVTADEVYGQAGYLRDWLEERDAAYVLAIRSVHAVTTTDGQRVVAAQAVAALPARAWLRLARARLAHASTTGHGSRSAHSGGPAAGTGCWPVDR